MNLFIFLGQILCLNLTCFETDLWIRFIEIIFNELDWLFEMNWFK
jgi:hypothetical protein